MLKTTKIGLILLVGSFFLFLFSLVSRLMDKEINFLSIENMFGLDWIMSIPGAIVQQLLTALSTASLSMIFLVVGTVSIVMSPFQKGN